MLSLLAWCSKSVNSTSPGNWAEELRFTRPQGRPIALQVFYWQHNIHGCLSHVFLWAEVVHLWLAYKGLRTNSWREQQWSQFFYCGCKGKGYMGCRGASHCILAVRTLWLLPVAQPLWHMSSYVKPRCQPRPLEIWLKLTHAPMPSLVRALNPQPSFHECVCHHAFLSLPALLFQCAAWFCPTSIQGAKIHSFLSHHWNCIQASVSLVTLLKMEGLKEESQIDWAFFGLFHFNMVNFMLCGFWFNF